MFVVGAALAPYADDGVFKDVVFAEQHSAAIALAIMLSDGACVSLLRQRSRQPGLA